MAIEFAAAGADVAINWLDDERAAESVADQVRSDGRRALMVKADVAGIAQTQGARREGDERVRWAARFRAGVSPTSPRLCRPPGAERGDLRGCRSWIPIPHERNRRAPQ